MSKGKWKRYKSDDNTKKTNFIGVKVTNNERARLEQLALICNLKLSEYIVSSSLYANTLSVISNREELNKLMSELISLGNNLNQATRSLNALLKSPSMNSASLSSALKIIENQNDKTVQLIHKIDALLESMKELK